jgi:hypothetical protein
MVCLRNICINTLHKGDSGDNNNNNKGEGFPVDALNVIGCCNPRRQECDLKRRCEDFEI